jgi:hypothetical protein
MLYRLEDTHNIFNRRKNFFSQLLIFIVSVMLGVRNTAHEDTMNKHCENCAKCFGTNGKLS